MKIPLSLVAGILAASFSAYAQQTTISLQQNWSFDRHGDDLGKGGMVAKDINKNGYSEIITTGTTYSGGYYSAGFYTILEYNPATGRYETKYTSRVYPAEITEVQLYDVDKDGTDEILLGFDNGEIRIFNALTGKNLFSFFTHKSVSAGPFDNNAVQSITFGDIDNDGKTNLIATNGDTTYVYDDSFRLIRKLNVKGGAKGTVLIADVDGDSAMETIYSGGSIVEYNGSISKLEYRFFPNPYGSMFSGPSVVKIADMTGDGLNDVIYSSSDSVHIINVLQKTRVKSIGKKEGWGAVTDIQLYDYTQDGRLDLFVGNDQFDVLFVYNGLSGSLEFSLNDVKQNGLEALVVADLDAEPGAELLWTSGANCSCSDHFYIYDLNTKAMKWMSKFQSSGFEAFDLGNVDSDDKDELVIASHGVLNHYSDQSFLSTIDVISKQVKSESINELGYSGIPTALKIADVDRDGKNEILLGVESSYAYTRILLLDQYYNFVRAFEANGMSFVQDIEVNDIDDDGENEVIATFGTHIAGSTHPEEWQNYVYIFDGKSGQVKWKSTQLAGMLSRVGNIIVGNVDSDPAKEILLLRYSQDSWRPQSSVLYIIDGWDFSVKEDASIDYSSFYLTDFDLDGIDDIIAGTESGEILVVNGESFEIKKEITSGKGKITSIAGADLNGDNMDEYIFTNSYRLQIYDPVLASIITETDTLSSNVGDYGSMRLYQNETAVEIFVNTSHTLYAFSLALGSNQKPSDFTLLTPVNHAELEPAEWVQFSWSAAIDESPVTYAFHIKGSQLDTVVINIPNTHFLMNAGLFQLYENYTWYVTATDNLLQTQSSSFEFQLSDLILGVELNEKSYTIYPNPFINFFTVHNPSSSTIDQVKIIQPSGREFVSKEVSIKPHSDGVVMNLESLPTGMYLCSLISKGFRIHTVKIVKH